jgi:hypothetical protein
LETAALPIELLACKKSPQKAEKAQLWRQIPCLLGFAMNSTFPIVPAEFLQLQLLGHRFLVLRGGVVPVFTLGTLKGDDFSTCARHLELLRT